MGWDGIERREHKRFGLKRLGIQYVKGGLFAFLTGYSDKYLVLNISEGGLYFMTKQELSTGNTIHFRIESAEGAKVKASGVVVWAQKSVDHDAFKVGVRYKGLSAGNRRRLRNLLDSAVLDKIDVSTTIYMREVERL